MFGVKAAGRGGGGGGIEIISQLRAA